MWQWFKAIPWFLLQVVIVALNSMPFGQLPIKVQCPRCYDEQPAWPREPGEDR